MADVELRNLTKHYGDFRAVDDLSLKVESGEFLSLIGPSGCGKTTTLRLIAGLIEPDEGFIYIRNEMVNDKPVHKRNIGMVFQSYALFPHMNVNDNVAFGLKMKGYSKKEISEKVAGVLDLIQLPGIGKRFPRQLSGGQQQRVALARAIVTEPAVLLLDEPMSNLDAKLREQMRIDLKQLQRKLGITAVYVTHDQIEAFTMSDRVIILNEGHIEQIGNPIDVYETPATAFVANFIGRSNIFRATVSQIGESGVQVTTKLGLKVTVPPYDNLADGQEICLAVRPERIRILGRNEEGSETNSFAGKIGFMAYLGASTQFQVISDSGETFLVEQQNIKGSQTKRIHERVIFEWSPEDCLLTDLPLDDYA